MLKDPSLCSPPRWPSLAPGPATSSFASQCWACPLTGGSGVSFQGQLLRTCLWCEGNQRQEPPVWQLLVSTFGDLALTEKKVTFHWKKEEKHPTLLRTLPWDCQGSFMPHEIPGTLCHCKALGRVSVEHNLVLKATNWAHTNQVRSHFLPREPPLYFLCVTAARQHTGTDK